MREREKQLEQTSHIFSFALLIPFSVQFSGPCYTAQHGPCLACALPSDKNFCLLCPLNLVSSFSCFRFPHQCHLPRKAFPDLLNQDKPSLLM